MRASGPHPPGRDADGRCQVSPARRAMRASGPHPPGRDADGRCQVSPARRAMRARGPRTPGCRSILRHPWQRLHDDDPFRTNDISENTTTRQQRLFRVTHRATTR